MPEVEIFKRFLEGCVEHLNFALGYKLYVKVDEIDVVGGRKTIDLYVMSDSHVYLHKRFLDDDVSVEVDLILRDLVVKGLFGLVSSYAPPARWVDGD